MGAHRIKWGTNQNFSSRKICPSLTYKLLPMALHCHWGAVVLARWQSEWT